jgi:hypothetical protein
MLITGSGLVEREDCCHVQVVSESPPFRDRIGSKRICRGVLGVLTVILAVVAGLAFKNEMPPCEANNETNQDTSLCSSNDDILI